MNLLRLLVPLLCTAFLTFHKFLIYLLSNLIPHCILPHTFAQISSHCLLRSKGEEKRSYVHAIANCSLSLMLSFSILGYHQFLVRSILFVSHHVHHWFFSLATDIPDVSEALSESLTFRYILCYLYIVFSYIGLSAQVTLTVDLLYLFNLPTILIYRVVAQLYVSLMHGLKVLWQLYIRKKETWLTCPYPSYLLSQNLKVIYGGMILLLLYGIAVLAFYYLWLAVVIVSLRFIMQTLINISQLLEQAGPILCVIKKWDPELPQISSYRVRVKKIISILLAVKWQSIIDCKVIVKICQGSDLMATPFDRQIPAHLPAPFRIFRGLRMLSTDQEKASNLT